MKTGTILLIGAGISAAIYLMRNQPSLPDKKTTTFDPTKFGYDPGKVLASSDQLKSFHVDQLQQLFKSTTSEEQRTLIVNELTARGYKVLRRKDDPSYLSFQYSVLPPSDPVKLPVKTLPDTTLVLHPPGDPLPVKTLPDAMVTDPVFAAPVLQKTLTTKSLLVAGLGYAMS